MKIKKLTLSALFIAIGVLSSHLLYIPVGVAKAFPVQHAINLLAATLLGPAYGVAIAFIVSLLRNILGTGSLLAFPGSMIGVFLAAILYQKTHRYSLAMAGEVIGTGIIGAFVSYPVAKIFMGREVAMFFFVIPFSASTVVGVVLGAIILKGLLHIKSIHSISGGGQL
ncbi:energy coupling factor transporter S component ThiW [Alkaliphilus serpentinus]|uniref:Energy coupling factor transporter S component ThiW n=1 Tax=Alkaliphilus serpentinus TaxID=1482731 RepID=A0A833HQ72_9FIRM|nr:energy coupling factor transporter S component ThiW [Alkaliphilus serpentinus]KAB3531530.1 energy coupling factor transporter S component ThiW [Alkaliphilus serpentinus]